MPLSLHKYLISSLKWLASFLFILIFCFVLWFADVLSTSMLLLITVAIDGLFVFLPFAYYFAMFLIYKRKSKSYTPKEGKISNWEEGFFRYTASVIVCIDDNEYQSSAYFTPCEAKELVGKDITYALIDDTLFIYNILCTKTPENDSGV